MTAAKLFETGDRVISVHDDTIQAEWRGLPGVVVGPSKVLRGAYYVNFDHTESDRMEDNGGSWLPEMLIKSPPAADRPWTPAIGDIVEWRWRSEDDEPENVLVGEVVDRYDDKHWTLRAQGGKIIAPQSELRPASRPSLPEAQFYGVQPSELPRELPAGTRVTFGKTVIAQGPVRLETRPTGGFGYWGDWGFKDGKDCYATPNVIDWASTPRQATHPPAPERTSPAASDTLRPADDVTNGVAPAVENTGRPDPYGIPRENEYCFYPASEARHVPPMKRTDPRPKNGTPFGIIPQADGTLGALCIGVNRLIHRENAEDDALSRVAASRSKRSAHVESHRLGFDVPARVRRDGRTGKAIEWIDTRKPPWECDE